MFEKKIKNIKHKKIKKIENRLHTKKKFMTYVCTMHHAPCPPMLPPGRPLHVIYERVWSDVFQNVNSIDIIKQEDLKIV